MNLDFTTEQKILSASAKDFLTKNCASHVVREARVSDEVYPTALWKSMAGMGWMGIAISEKYGGTEGCVQDLAVLVETMGAACAPVPFFTTVVVCGTALQLSKADKLKEQILPAIASGELVVSYALIEPGNTYGFSNIQTIAEESDGEYILTGTKLFVEYAEGADYFLTVAKVAGKGLAVFMVDAKSSGITLKAMPTLDYSKQCEVVLDSVRVSSDQLLAVGDEAQTLLSAVEQVAAVAKCSEILGAIQLVLDISVTYAKDRTQFDQPIGGFQSIQHHCANMAVDVDSSRYLTGMAAWKVSQGLVAAKEVSMAKSFASKAGVRICKLGHQIHGAISFCDEHDMHLFLRKSQAASMAFGDQDYHLERVAQELGL
ncbi:MAG: alkylation response protein AidB-like acyl-CoA dehydrogenase [Oceanicoccus sp.]|jgi:alkylation response protein AidB-like acyl-CoA dehydrogenase